MFRYWQSRFWRCMCSGKRSNYRHYSKGLGDNKDLYSTLGVSQTATQSEIKQAYYNLTMKYHPDRSEGNPEAALKFREVTEAYEVLGNAAIRGRYDIGGMSAVESTIPRAKKAPIKHHVKHARFFEERNYWQSQSKQRATIGDKTDRFSSKGFDKPDDEYSSPEEKKNHERLKQLGAFFILSVLVYKSHVESWP